MNQLRLLALCWNPSKFFWNQNCQLHDYVLRKKANGSKKTPNNSSGCLGSVMMACLCDVVSNLQCSSLNSSGRCSSSAKLLDYLGKIISSSTRMAYWSLRVERTDDEIWSWQIEGAALFIRSSTTWATYVRLRTRLSRRRRLRIESFSLVLSLATYT